MKLSSRFLSINTIVKAKIFNKRIPLAIRWQLTNRCTCKCLYCNIWADGSDHELSTRQIFSIIDSLKESGTQRISFSGGEPLFREDIGKILNYCHKKNISISMNSNGELVPQKIKEIETLDLLKLSLDGPEEIHDRLSNHQGSYQKVLRAVEATQAEGIKTIFTTTLTKYNIEHLDFVLKIAERFNTLAAFQPLKRFSRGIDDLEAIMPEERKYKEAIARFIKLKQEGNKHMRNSIIELRHIYSWPNYKRLECGAGKIFCMIGVNGRLYPCDRIQYKTDLPNCLTAGFRNAFAKLPKVICCDGCGFCGTLELNFLLSFRLGVVEAIRKIVD